MPAAREALLDAARTELTRRPWPVVRMVEVAAAAGVSRQTLYNEFGDKDGLAHALVRRAADRYLDGVEHVLTSGRDGADPRERLTAAAQWTVAVAAADPLVHAALTGCWSDRLPVPRAPRRIGRVPRRRRAGAEPLPSPGELLGQARDRAVSALANDWPEGDAADLGRACEAVTRLALSCVVAPAGPDRVADLVREALPSPAPRGRGRARALTGRSRRAGDR
ncbi:TetR family transcriptional regulator [Streptomyces sp. NPDC018031]|uniref:TetR family transcriptional regulator n=1 Tax=Streptomyces sp. NPDC018031 TaxID=3365033 RepID=UPI00379341FE